MSDYVIECIGIKKTFVQRTIPLDRLQDRILRLGRSGNTMRIQALKPTTVRVKHGQWVGLYGPNGSGKTTFMKIVAGLHQPDRGTVICRGTLSSFFELGIGFHLERPAHENIRLHGLLHGLYPAEIRRMTDKILEFADIGDFANLPLKCYSTGMRMRLAFAASSAIEADIYLFDEILAVGDASFQEKCRAHLKKLREKKKTVIIVSHNLESLTQMTDKVMFFDKGQVISTRHKHIKEEHSRKTE